MVTKLQLEGINKKSLERHKKLIAFLLEEYEKIGWREYLKKWYNILSKYYPEFFN